MDLNSLTQEQISTLKKIAQKMNISLNELLETHSDINSLLESYNNEEFGILND